MKKAIEFSHSNLIRNADSLANKMDFDQNDFEQIGKNKQRVDTTAYKLPYHFLNEVICLTSVKAIGIMVMLLFCD